MDFFRKQLAEMIEDGGKWAVIVLHADLVRNHATIPGSSSIAALIWKAMGIKAYSFAYPFGLSDWYVSKKVYEYGYKAGLGVGTGINHSQGTVYNLSRREVYGDYDLEEFQALIPWLDPPYFNYPLRNIPR
jgi:hypothetical protein